MSARDLAFAGDLRGAQAAIAGRRDREATWLRAYIAAARGALADAERQASALIDGDDEIAVDAALTLGSILRQTGRHAGAAVIDAAAIARAGDEPRRAHALISYAADHVGLGDAAACATHLQAAAALGVRAWRVRVRHAWVRCEHGLMTADPGTAASAASDALACSRRAHARRHEAKSLLFLGVALRQAGETAAADGALRGARDLARTLGARPIERVAASVLAGR